jgi:hypothetical protein
VAQAVQAEEVTRSGQRTFLLSPKCGHFYCRLTFMRIFPCKGGHGSQQGNTCSGAFCRRKPLMRQDIGKNWTPPEGTKVLPKTGHM